MSSKKKTKKMDVVSGNADPKDIAKDMAKSIAKMYEDRDKKVTSAKEHLVSQLKITSDKYRTANGVMSALDTVRLVFGKTIESVSIDEQVSIAKTSAKHMASVAQAMGEKAGTLDPDGFKDLCDGFYAKEFADGDATALDMIDELMTLQLCQNVGPSAEDVADFCAQADEEIEKARNDLRSYCEENKLDFDEVCGEKQ